jgi:hypothetical protein
MVSVAGSIGLRKLFMKTKDVLLICISLFMLAGCASGPEPADVAVRLGMSRDHLRLHFGEPLRIESAADGGEDWYYRFVSWKTHAIGESGTMGEYGERTSYVSVGLEFSKDPEECPIHVSAEGYVIEPLPNGKVVH